MRGSVIMKIYNFDQIIGQTNTKDWIISKLQQDKIPHILAFIGQPGIGKTSLAKVLACELACLNDNSRIGEIKEKVIGNDTSTDCVKLYNMSNIKSDEEVLNVRNDLTLGLSTTGRKVIILDEAHGMSEAAQDSLLTRFESISDDVYVIICSTELGRFKDAFRSRCVVRNFARPTNGEMRKLITTYLNENNIKFAIPIPMAITFIMSSCNNEPRRIINLLNALDNTRVVTRDDLMAFNILVDDREYYRLVHYLYSNNIVDGLNFISDMGNEFTKEAVSLYLEMIKVGLGSQSNIISAEIKRNIVEIVEEKGIDKLMKFVTAICSERYPSKNFISGIFLKLCSNLDEKPYRVDNMRLSDAKVMTSTDQDDIPEISQTNQTLSLDQLFSQAQSL